MTRRAVMDFAPVARAFLVEEARGAGNPHAVPIDPELAAHVEEQLLEEWKAIRDSYPYIYTAEACVHFACRVRIAIECKLADCWVGFFWDRRPEGLHVWVCVVPCLPIHLTFYKTAHDRERSPRANRWLGNEAPDGVGPGGRGRVDPSDARREGTGHAEGGPPTPADPPKQAGPTIFDLIEAYDGKEARCRAEAYARANLRASGTAAPRRTPDGLR